MYSCIHTPRQPTPQWRQLSEGTLILLRADCPETPTYRKFLENWKNNRFNNQVVETSFSHHRYLACRSRYAAVLMKLAHDLRHAGGEFFTLLMPKSEAGNAEPVGWLWVQGNKQLVQFLTGTSYNCGYIKIADQKEEADPKQKHVHGLCAGLFFYRRMSGQINTMRRSVLIDIDDGSTEDVMFLESLFSQWGACGLSTPSFSANSIYHKRHIFLWSDHPVLIGDYADKFNALTQKIQNQYLGRIAIDPAMKSCCQTFYCTTKASLYNHPAFAPRLINSPQPQSDWFSSLSYKTEDTLLIHGVANATTRGRQGGVKRARGQTTQDQQALLKSILAMPQPPTAKMINGANRHELALRLILTIIEKGFTQTDAEIYLYGLSQAYAESCPRSSHTYEKLCSMLRETLSNPRLKRA